MNQSIRFTSQLLLGLAVVLAGTLEARAEVRNFTGSNSSQLQTFINNTVQSGDTVRFNNNISFNQVVVVSGNKSNILFVSNGGKKTLTHSNTQPHFRVFGENIGFSGIIFQNATGNGFYGSIDPRGNGLSVSGCEFYDGFAGILWVGGGIANLSVKNCTFGNTKAGIWWVRDVVRSVGNKWNRSFYPGRMVIQNNWFWGSRLEVGILMDAGNDGKFLPNPTPNNPSGTSSYPSQNDPLRLQAQTRVSNLQGGAPNYARSEISGNQMFGVQLFGIGMARCEGFNITNNTIRMSSGGSLYRNGIQLENRTRGFSIYQNNFELNGGTGFPAAFDVVTFSDHGNPAHKANGCRAGFSANGNVIINNQNQQTGTLNMTAPGNN